MRKKEDEEPLEADNPSVRMNPENPTSREKQEHEDSRHAVYRSVGAANSHCTIRLLAGLTSHGFNTLISNAVKRGSQETQRTAESRDPTPPSLADLVVRSNRTDASVFCKCCPVFFFGAILGFVKSCGVSARLLLSSIGSTVVKKTACLPFLRLFPHELMHFFSWNSIHSRSRPERCTQYNLLVTVQCLATQDQ